MRLASCRSIGFQGTDAIRDEGNGRTRRIQRIRRTEPSIAEHTCTTSWWQRMAWGYGDCQASLALHAAFVREYLNIDSGQKAVCGIAFGYEDTTHPVSCFQTERERISQSGLAGLFNRIRQTDISIGPFIAIKLSGICTSPTLLRSRSATTNSSALEPYLPEPTSNFC